MAVLLWKLSHNLTFTKEHKKKVKFMLFMFSFIRTVMMYDVCTCNKNFIAFITNGNFFLPLLLLLLLWNKTSVLFPLCVLVITHFLYEFYFALFLCVCVLVVAGV